MDYRDEFRRRVGRADIDTAERPTRAEIEGMTRGVFLHWDNALDDAGQLRRCIACVATWMACPAGWIKKNASRYKKTLWPSVR